MIGFHLQGNVKDWPDAARQLPDYAPMKFTDGGPQRAVETKGINKTLHTSVRYVVHAQVFAGNYHQAAREHFAKFVDETFRKHAWAVDAVFEWNEYLANSQTQAERNERIEWARACVDVWRNEYRTQAEYSHIDLIIAEAAVGNDIPPEMAKLSHDNSWVHLGYHGYVPVWQGDIRPNEWRWYSGRWDEMDKRFRAMGYTATWYIGEFGAVGHNGPGWPNSLAPNDGWEHENVYNGNLAAYINMMKYWMDRARQTQAWKDGRLIGATIFTSGGGSLWRHFELKQPEMGLTAQAVSSYMATIPLPPTPPPNPPLPPEPQPTWQDELWHKSIELQTISLNPDAALQAAIFDDGYVPVESEFWHTVDGVEYAAQAAEHLGNGTRRVYYAVVPGWDDVDWFSDDFAVYAWPTDSKHITQQFGENVEAYKDRFGLCCGHNGLDIGTNNGDPVYAVADGKVESVSVDKHGYGLHIIMSHDNGYETLYAHLLSSNVKEGQRILAGSVIGKADNSGASTGSHLHLGVFKDGIAVDPMLHLEGFA